MTKSSATGMSLLVIWAVCGCAHTRNVEVLESHLRRQEHRLRALESELSETRSKLETARRETEIVRSRLARRGEKTPRPEQTMALARLTGVRINGLLTGGLDRDDRPGDELLTTVLVPHDADGETVKIDGRIELQVFDLAQPRDKQRLGGWSFSVEEARRNWHSGFLASGFQFRLPWPQTPTSSELLLHARFITSDGRQFDTSRTIQVTPPPSRPAEQEDGPDAQAGSATIEPAGFETAPGESAESDAEAPPPFPAAGEPSGPSAAQPSGPRGAGDPPPKPFPASPSIEGSRPLRTSDKWTDETIPYLR